MDLDREEDNFIIVESPRKDRENKIEDIIPKFRKLTIEVVNVVLRTEYCYLCTERLIYSCFTECSHLKECIGNMNCINRQKNFTFQLIVLSIFKHFNCRKCKYFILLFNFFL